MNPILTIELSDHMYTVAKLESGSATNFCIVAPGGKGMVKAPDAEKAKGFSDYLSARNMADALNNQAALAPLLDGPAPVPRTVPMVLPCTAGWKAHLSSLMPAQDVPDAKAPVIHLETTRKPLRVPVAKAAKTHKGTSK